MALALVQPRRWSPPFSIRRTFCPPGDGATVVAVIGIDRRERTAWIEECREDTPGGVERPDLEAEANERLATEWDQDVADALDDVAEG